MLWMAVVVYVGYVDDIVLDVGSKQAWARSSIEYSLASKLFPALVRCDLLDGEKQLVIHTVSKYARMCRESGYH
jgi:hypothetical protein